LVEVVAAVDFRASALRKAEACTEIKEEYDRDKTTDNQNPSVDFLCSQAKIRFYLKRG
jgi:hypothetical protein